MSAKRRTPFDERWERTPGNLLIPREASSWRFVQKLGTAQCCCGPSCLLFGGSPPSSIGLELSGLSDTGACAKCDEANGLYEITEDLSSWDSGQEPPCSIIYEDYTPGVVSYSVTFSYSGPVPTPWIMSVSVRPNECYGFAEIGNTGYLSSDFETGSSYGVTLAASQCGGGSATVYT